MGKRLISQNRGKGTPTYRAPPRRKADLTHLKVEAGRTITCVLTEIVHDSARNAPIGKVRVDSKEKYILIPEGVAIGDELAYGDAAEPKIGNTLPLGNIPEGFPVCNIEIRRDDGGKLVRASGSYATIISHEGDRTLVQLPSGVKKWFDSRCLATVGVVAGGGRTEKPFVKAGKKYHKMKAKAAKWPRTSAVAMNPIDHPFGGGKHQHVGRPKTVARGAPPGRKVGSIAARRTGRGKRKK
ncbi:50S ribosomal protein L2 [Candidatus Alkanophaga liquidiphilum]|nr:Ribosomal protein L2 [Candidatus Alkanophaga liquidiphilum]RLG38517.1 MAG: 50S ribosomal protein L2 [Candidatus Alkanophagales archaeon]